MVGGPRELALPVVRMICLNRGQLSGLVERTSRLWLHSCQILLAGAAIYWYLPCLLFERKQQGPWLGFLSESRWCLRLSIHSTV
jgi:hypothetical protein